MNPVTPMSPEYRSLTGHWHWEPSEGRRRWSLVLQPPAPGDSTWNCQCDAMPTHSIIYTDHMGWLPDGPLRPPPATSHSNWSAE